LEAFVNTQVTRASPETSGEKNKNHRSNFSKEGRGAKGRKGRRPTDENTSGGVRHFADDGADQNGNASILLCLSGLDLLSELLVVGRFIVGFGQLQLRQQSVMLSCLLLGFLLLF
jgi:hypothetical protein